MTDHRLDLGPIGASLDLVDADGMAGLREYWFTALADGFSFGNPESVRQVIASQVLDGDDERILRYGNRTIQFAVQVNSMDLDGVAKGERALHRMLGTRTLLRWTPPDSIGRLTRFEVLAAEWQQQFDDLDEVRAGVKTRTWQVSLTCKPFGTSEAPVMAMFTPSTVEPAVLDDASSTARYSVPSGQGTLSTSTYGDGSSVRLDSTVTLGRTNQRPVTFMPASVPSQAFVGVDVARSTGVRLDYFAEPVAVEPGANYTRYWFRNPGSASFTFNLLSDRSSSSGTSNVPHYWFIGGVYAASTLNTRGMVVTEVEGSVRTQGSVTVTRTSPMSWVSVYADPAMQTYGYSPAVQATWPLAPTGRYVLYLKGTSVSTSGDTIVATITDSNGIVASATTITQGTTDTFRPIGEVQLGSRRDGTLGTLTATVTRNATAVDPGTLEYRLYRMADDTTLTFVRAATSATEYVLEPPSLEQPNGALWVGGAAADDSRIVRYEPPILRPGPCSILVEADSSATNPVSVAVSYWPSFGGFAA